jgi:23S rRNA pseudouridine2605 synthase
MAMVHLFSRQTKALSGGILIAATRATAFLSPGYRSVNIVERVNFSSSALHSRSTALFASSNVDPKLNSIQSRSKVISSEGKSWQKKGGGDKNKPLRADKVLSHRASLSRSEAFDAIQRRRVAWRKSPDTEMIPVKGPKEKLSMNAILYMDGKEILQLPPILIAFHKPKFMLSAMDEKHSNKKHLGMVFPKQYEKLNIHPVGRLDYDSSGLLLFSMEGELTQRLLHPKHSVEKEYVATVAGGKVDAVSLKKLLEEDGVETKEGIHFANLLDVEEIGLEESQSIMDDHLKAEKAKGDDAKHFDSELPLTNVRITVQEGKYRMVRRMLANCKHPVIELRRDRHGNVELKDLKEGEFRECNESEIEWAEGLLKG